MKREASIANNRAKRKRNDTQAIHDERTSNKVSSRANKNENFTINTHNETYSPEMKEQQEKKSSDEQHGKTITHIDREKRKRRKQIKNVYH